MSGRLDQAWFEMADLRRRRFAGAVCVPLRASELITNDLGAEETFAANAVAIALEKRAAAEHLGWSDMGLLHSGGPFASPREGYKPCDTARCRPGIPSFARSEGR